MKYRYLSKLRYITLERIRTLERYNIEYIIFFYNNEKLNEKHKTLFINEFITKKYYHIVT